MVLGIQRYNAKTPHPNPDITFITALEEYDNHPEALKILEALAAQFRRITKAWGFGVTSLVEHEYNTQFSGRNWNGGEIIEIVLRRRDGSFAPYQFLLYVMAHELAHIKEMNHSWAFKQVNTHIRKELAALRAQGYYGDGFWSTGRALTSGRQEVAFEPDEQPVYTCGGAFNRQPRRRVRSSVIANRSPRGAARLGRTGRQTAIAPKAGGRVRKEGAFGGGGHVLDASPEVSTFKRRANSNAAFAARLAAAEARADAEKRAKEKEAKKHVDKKPKLSSSPNGSPVVDLCSSDEDDSEVEIIDEDPPVDDYTEEERAWMAKDIGNWQDEVEIVEDGDARASGSGGVKSAAKDAAKGHAGSGSLSNKGKKRLVESSDEDDEPKPKKIVPKKIVAQAPPAAARRWRAPSEERERPAPAKPARRPPMTFFKNDTSAQQRLDESLGRKKRRSKSSSSSPPKSRKRLVHSSDEDGSEVDELAGDDDDDDDDGIAPAVVEAYRADPEGMRRFVLRKEMEEEEREMAREPEEKRLRRNAKARVARKLKKEKEKKASASTGNAVAGPSGSKASGSGAKKLVGPRGGSQWNCRACTFLNDYHESACAVCLSKR